MRAVQLTAGVPGCAAQGPDAREKRDGMGSMADGWCVDHDSPAGQLATLFSAPDYPQFYAEGEARAFNRAAVAVLRPPHYDEPEVLVFSAAPRPAAQPFYDPGVAGSDEEGPDGQGGGSASDVSC
jgi:serine/threonine-protein phosphatase 5